MDTLIKAICKLAAADMQALSTYVFTAEAGDPGHVAERFSRFWRESVASRQDFVREYTEGMIELLEMQRTLAIGQFDRISRDTERVAAELARNTERSMAIATQARRHAVDRRVFPLPLPDDRRGRATGNRRGSGVIREHRSAG